MFKYTLACFGMFWHFTVGSNVSICDVPALWCSGVLVLSCCSGVPAYSYVFRCYIPFNFLGNLSSFSCFMMSFELWIFHLQKGFTESFLIHRHQSDFHLQANIRKHFVKKGSFSTPSKTKLSGLQSICCAKSVLKPGTPCTALLFVCLFFFFFVCFCFFLFLFSFF